MVAVYNNDRALNVISLLNACEIVTLDIFLDESLGQEAAEYVFKYTIVNDYPEAEREEIKKKINQVATGYFIKAVNEVSEFMNMKSNGNVKGFSLTFDIRENKLKVNKVYSNLAQESDCDNFHGLLDKLKEVKANNLKSKTNMYHKIPNPNGKRPKYEQMTFEEVIDTLKDMEM